MIQIENKTFLTYLFSFYILFYPFLLFNISFLKYGVKYPTVLLTFFLLVPYALSKLKAKFHAIYIFVLILTFSYINFNIGGSLEYISLGGITFLFSLIFEKENNLRHFLKIYTVCGILVSFHALLQYFLSLSGVVNLIPFYKILNTPHMFNPIFGVFDSKTFSELRISSFFTEANRLGYFLLPLIFIYTSFKNKYSKILIAFFFLVIVLTKSFATLGIFLICRIIFYRNLRGLFLTLLSIFLGIILIQLNPCSLSYHCDFDFSEHLYRGRSIGLRLASFYHLIETLPANPFGIPFEVLEELSDIAPIYSAIVFWALVGGWVSLFSFAILIILIIYRCWSFIKINPHSQYRGLCIGIISYSLLEVFMGTGFSGLLNVFISIVIALPLPKRFSWI